MYVFFTLLLLFPRVSFAAKPLALESLEPDRATLIMGGSFSPPTLAHLAAMADLLYEQEFPRGIFLVAKPYKAGAAPAEVSLRLTRVAVETFDYVLHRRNIPFRDFRVRGPGRVSWIGKSGRTVDLEVSSFDIDHGVTDSIESIRHFSAQFGPRNVWWLAGGDSAASMPRWGSWWGEMFERTNMIFIGRPAEAGELTVDHLRSDPLRGLYPEDFLATRTYLKVEGGHHVYRDRAGGRPSIFVMGKSTLPYSSTQTRKSLKTPEPDAAERMLTPAVYRAIIANNDYAAVRSFLTRENLERYLLDEFRLVGEGRGNIERYNTFLDNLVKEIARAPAPDLDSRETRVATPAPPRPFGGALSPALADLRHQLVLFDPRVLLSRARLSDVFALTPHSRITLNLVRSQMSFDVPLVERQTADRKNRWYDLNVSTNELLATLADPALARGLERASRGVEGAFANALLAAIHLDGPARRRLELFTGRRYFNRLALGLVRPEFRAELDEAERRYEDWAERTLGAFARRLRPRQIQRLGETLGDLYLVRRTAVRDEAFWDQFWDLALTGYPGEVLDLARPKTVRALRRRIVFLARALSRLDDHSVSVIRYRGREIARLEGEIVRWRGPLAARDLPLETSDLGVIAGVTEYIARLPGDLDVFAPPGAAAASSALQFLPLRSTRHSPALNLVRDLHVFHAEVTRDLEAMRETFDTLPTAPSPELITRREAALARVRDLERGLGVLERRWLHAKMAHPFAPLDADIPGYAEALASYGEVRAELGRAVDRVRAVNHVALGMVPSLAEAESLTPTSRDTLATSREWLWREVLGDALTKYVAGEPAGVFGPDRDVVIERLKDLSTADLEGLSLREILIRLSPGRSSERGTEVYRWLHQKYGLLDEPALRLITGEDEGTYRSHGRIGFRFETPRLHPLFDFRGPSALEDLPAYLARKWGGLRRIAEPGRIVFSTLGTADTLAGLRAQGFTEFYRVNSSYATRGSRTMIAFEPGGPEPLVVFHSFIGEDLYQHKLMQLALDFGEDFARVRTLTSDGPKSWDRARRVVTAAIAGLGPRRIDDLVLGYGEVVERMLAETPFARLVGREALGDFARVARYDVEGKNGFARRVLVVTDVAYRYFGKSVLPLIEPFLERGVDRVIFAGSAGALSNEVPRHGLVVPRTFQVLGDEGFLSGFTRARNDLFALAPFGVGHSGRHVSVPSPLVETQDLVRDLRDRDAILSVDVEGAQIARLIDLHNANRRAPRVRFAAAFIATDVPRTNAQSNVGYGLHAPDFADKARAKTLYASHLKLLWDIPTHLGFSAHTALVAAHFHARIDELARVPDSERLARLKGELRERLTEVRALARRGGRVSRGLIRVLGDLSVEAHRLDPAGEGRPPAVVEPAAELEESTPPLAEALARVVMLQSLGRSSTLNSGDVVHNRERGDAAEVRARGRAGAERAVDWIIERRARRLGPADALALNGVLNAGVVAGDKLEDFARFTHLDESGRARSSRELVEDFFAWLDGAPPSVDTALEAYARYEAIHPHRDGNGRTAELIAQHTLLRAKRSPVLFPNRFDIDYVLSLKRNGGTAANAADYRAGVVKMTRQFREGLLAATSGREVTGSQMAPDFDGLYVTLDDASTLALGTLYHSARPPRQEREARVFAAADDLPRDIPSVRIARREYEVTYYFGNEPPRCQSDLVRPGDAPTVDLDPRPEG